MSWPEIYEEHEETPEPKKKCSKCKREKPLTAFWSDNTKRDGLKPHCADCEYKRRKKLEKVKGLSKRDIRSSNVTKIRKRLDAYWIEKGLKPAKKEQEK